MIIGMLIEYGSRYLAPGEFLEAENMSEQVLSVEKPLSPAARQMRETRRRRADGLRCVILEIRDTEIDALIARGLLPRDKRNSKIAISSALYEILDQALPSAD